MVGMMGLGLLVFVVVDLCVFVVLLDGVMMKMVFVVVLIRLISLVKINVLFVW